jgi:CheY-specific phosphatase CheX
MLTLSEFSTNMPGCCAEVLDAMYFTTVLDTTPQTSLPLEEPHEFAFALTFDGDLQGRFGLQIGASAAFEVAANFLGEDQSGVSTSEVAEVIGELTNMLCGSLVSRSTSKRTFTLSHPEPIDPNMTSLDADFVILRHDTDYGVLTTWITLDRSSVLS